MTDNTPAYPVPPASDWTVTGGTVAGSTITATSTDVSVSRTVSPLFLCGEAGMLIWSITITASLTVDRVTFRAVSGPDRRAVVRTGAPASAVLAVIACDTPATLQVAATCPIGAVLTISEGWAQDPRPAPALMPAEPGFGDASPNGVIPPPASAALSAFEAETPARRSPQVRAAQLSGSRRPDLLPRQNAFTP